MTTIANLADLFQAGDLAGLGKGLSAAADRLGLPLGELAYDVYAALHARQDGPGALTCIAFCVDEGQPALALSTFEQFRARFGVEAMSKRTRFNIGSLLVAEKRIDEAFDMFKAALELAPDLGPARANILHLARGEHHPGAIAFIERQSAEIAAALSRGVERGGDRSNRSVHPDSRLLLCEAVLNRQTAPNAARFARIRSRIGRSKDGRAKAFPVSIS
jgi:hypothetical protein